MEKLWNTDSHYSESHSWMEGEKHETFGNQGNSENHPFLLVDYIEDYEPGEYAVGYKCVTYREDFFAGHFPQEPVMPGVLIVEALAQVGAVAVLMQEENKGKLGYFGGIKNCKFRRKVVPGDKLKLEARIIRQKGPLVIGEAVASVDGEVAVKAELSLMIGKAETDD
mgnify:CR=1 FL=1